MSAVPVPLARKESLPTMDWGKEEGVSGLLSPVFFERFEFNK